MKDVQVFGICVCVSNLWWNEIHSLFIQNHLQTPHSHINSWSCILIVSENCCFISYLTHKIYQSHMYLCVFSYNKKYKYDVPYFICLCICGRFMCDPSRFGHLVPECCIFLLYISSCHACTSVTILPSCFCGISLMFIISWNLFMGCRFYL